MKNWFCIFGLTFISIGAFSQRSVRDSAIATTILGVQYGINTTSGDLADRYGLLNHLGIFTGYKTQSNWIFGLDANFIFGNDIKVPDMFGHLRDSYGNITDVNGDIAKVYVFSRGMYANVAIGKLFPILSPNENSGIQVHVGAGYLVHHFRIETQDQVIPQLELEYRKGYDRLVSGLNTHQFIGYSFMANRGFFNFYGGFYMQEGFTYDRRTVFFDQPDTPVSTAMRMDIQYGIRAGWMIPVYKRRPKDFYYN